MMVTRTAVVTAVVTALLIAGLVALAFVIYTEPDPAARLRTSMLILVALSWPIALIGRFVRKAPPLPIDEERPRRRRFVLLRRVLSELVREATRLNWMVVELQRSPSTNKSLEFEVAQLKSQLRDQLEEVIAAAGQISGAPESEEPFEPRFRNAVEEEPFGVSPAPKE